MKSYCFLFWTLTAVLLVESGNVVAGDVLPSTPDSAVQAIRAAQHRHDDAHVLSLERHLSEVRSLADRASKDALRPRLAQALGSEDEVLTSRRSEAAAKRQQVRALRDEILARVDSLPVDAGTVEFRRKLTARFQQLDADLVGIERADRRTLGSRSRQLIDRLAGWESARPVGPIPEPNWKQEVTPPVEAQPLPSAEAPRFAIDTLWLLRNQIAGADSGGAVPAALRQTPPEASACGYIPADLAETPEAQKSHPDIQALAAQLDYNPLRIFEWVNQKVTYEPYFGSLKGGVSTLQGKAGGATDQASLLIALLRASNIPARYVRGTVAMLDGTTKNDPDGRAPRWIGAKNYAGAAWILSNNNNPYVLVDAKGIHFAHVWVEACLPYAAYRGAAIDDSGHRWVALDPSYKDHRYQLGVVLDSSLNFNYSNWLASRLDAQGRYRLPHEAFNDQAIVNARTKAPNYANNTLEDIPYKSEIKRRHFDILPVVPPYEVVRYDSWSGVAGESAEVAALPDRHRYRLKVTVRNASASQPETYAGNILSQKTVNVAELANGRLTLAFRGATTADQTAYNNWLNSVDASAAPTCSASVSVVPVLRLNGVEQAKDMGSGTTTLCSSNNVLQMQVTLAEHPTRSTVNAVNFSAIAASSMQALHAYAWHTSDAYLVSRAEKLLGAVRSHANPNVSEEARDATEGEFLNLAASRFSRYVADTVHQVSRQFSDSGTSGVSLGLTSAQVKVNYLFDLPYGLFRKGFLIDAPGYFSTSTRLTGGVPDFRAFKLFSFSASAYEAFIWQEMARMDAVSTTRGLQFAKEQGIEILQIDNLSQWSTQKSKLTTNSNSVLNYSAAHVADIESRYVNQGFKLTIPRSLIRYPDASGWRGAVFYTEKFSGSSGSAGFPINSYSGGVTIEPPDDSAPGTSGEGEAYGGITGNQSFVGRVYNSLLGTGVKPEATAPVAAQQTGRNSMQASNGACSAGATCSGDPVNMVTGNLVHSERDISIKGRGGLPLVFERWYNSKNPKDGPLGFGWTHSFNHFIRFYGVEGATAKVGWNDGTGGERFFSTTNHSSGNINVGAAFAAPAGIYATVERLSDGKYRIIERSGMKYVFESVVAGATDTGVKARLLSITDRRGNTLSLSYGPACGNNLCTVTDALNRALTFGYTGSRIAQISDWSGRQWKYVYDGNGDLIRFDNPLAAAGTQPPVTYEYYSTADGSNLAHEMKLYRLPRGNGMRFEYYQDGRVFRHTPFDLDGEPQQASATSFVWVEFRREAQQIDGLGHMRRFLFDANGNPLSITDEAGAETTYSYDSAAGRTHLRLSKTTPSGQTTNYAYDTQGNLTDVTLPSGRTLQYRDHTAFGQPRRIKDGNGHWTLMRFDAAGNLTDEIRTVAGFTPTADVAPSSANIASWVQTQYDSVGNPTKVRRLRDWNGAVLGNASSGIGPALESSFDASQLNVVGLTRRGDLDGTPASLEIQSYTDFQYDSLGRMKRGPDAAWYAADYDWDSLDRPVKSPDGRGNTWSTVFDANGNPLYAGLVLDGRYEDSHYASWDALDRLERKVDYAGYATLTEYNVLGHVRSVTGTDGYTVGFDVDPLGRVTGAYNEEGHRVSLVLDPDGRPRSVTDPNGLTTGYSYHDSSQDGLLKRTTLPKVDTQSQGRAVEIAQYDGAGRPTRIDAIAADGSVRDSYRFYDDLGRLTREVGPPVSSTDTSRPVTCLVYTVLGDTKEVWAGSTTDTTSGTCNLSDISLKKQYSASFDDWGRMLSRTDALGQTSRWTWNEHGQLTASRSPVQIAAGQSTTYQYGTKGVNGEVQGQLKRRTVQGSGGQTVDYTRNGLGQVTRVETKDGAGTLVVAYDYSYDVAHRLASVTDSRGQKALTYTWSPGGRLAQVRDGDGHSASYAYDAVGRLSSIAAPNGEHVSFVWDAGGRLVEQRLNSGLRTTQTWFEDGSLKERKNLHGSTTRSSHLFTLDVQGRRATQSENIGGATKSWTYQYDNLDRLTSASDGTAETYAYDIWGNRRSKTRSGVMTAYLYDEAHRLTEIRSGGDTGALIGAAIHDADGHLTKLCEGAAVSKTTSDCTASGTGASALTLTWNALDHLQSATRTGANAIVESYAYDDAARRLSKTSGAATTHYLYDGDDIYAEWSGGSSSNLTGVPTAVYIHGAGTDNPILRLTGSTNTPSATQLAYLQDGLGSVVGMATPAGVLSASQRFDAWGNRTTGSGSVAQYGYTGREPDATGLTYYRARYYHAGLGRFLSRDPAGMADSVSPYAYVANNPVNLVDPFGLQAQLVTPSSQSSYPQTVQVAFCLPCMQAATTMTDVIAGAIGGSVGNQSLQGGRGAGSNVDPLGPQRDSSRGLSSPTPIGEVVVGATIVGLGYNLIDKMSTEIQGITERKDLGPQGEVYSLRATRSGEYPNVRGGTTHLEAGEVYRYGETTTQPDQPDARWPQKALEATGLEYQTEYRGSQTMAKVVEKLRIYGHVLENGSLPPGNKIFR
jgi:RHS repeat-associated protein